MYTTGEPPSNFPNLLVLQVATQLQVLKEQRKACWGCPWAVLSTDVNGFVWKLKNTLKWPCQWTWCSQPSKSYFQANLAWCGWRFRPKEQQRQQRLHPIYVAPPWKFQLHVLTIPPSLVGSATLFSDIRGYIPIFINFIVILMLLSCLDNINIFRNMCIHVHTV